MSYAIKESFVTLQGEGARAGTRAVFLRFAGCNLWTGRPEDRHKGTGACAQWCDTDFFKGSKLSASDISAQLQALWGPTPGPRWVVLTGGEPLLQVNAGLLVELAGAGWKTALETNGTVPVPTGLSWVTVSPKRGTELVVTQADEVKVVLPGSATDPWTPETLRELQTKIRASHYYVQPQDPIIPDDLVGVSYLHGRAPALADQYKANLKACIDFVMDNPSWKLCQQAHKFWDLP